MRPRRQENERTCFQESAPYTPQTDSRADVAVVYGLNPTFEDRVEVWRSKGYRIHVMTGVAWGDYADYVRGEWDGTPHFDDAQTETGDFRLEHGIGQGHDIYYMIPSRPYARFLSERLRRVVDAGATALHLEEPEFWVRAGYGKSFEREWREFYGEPWQDPVGSPDARYRASKLMQHLYTRALTTLFADIKQYALEKGIPDFKCYVPTHSLVNYAHWRIVSPESRLLDVPDCDGMIGQVWTGTSRTPTVYGGLRKQRTFESGLCEYAACAAIVRGTEKQLWQLADPIEDNPHYCWEDYRVNWECTVTASLLVPESNSFEIMPWPRRIFLRDYPAQNLDGLPLAPLLADYLQRLQAEGETDLHRQTLRSMEIYERFVAAAARDYPVETIGFANLAEQSDVVRFGDVWRDVLGFYKHLATWPDQKDAQEIRSAINFFYHNAAPERIGIPASYATELQTVFNALADMDWPEETAYLHGSDAVAVALSDSLMFQRGEPQGSDDDLSSFYGLTMPLIKNGIPVRIAQLERAGEPTYLDAFKVIFLTYEGQKPPHALAHEGLANWVRRGGVLVLVGDGDAYNSVREWWNQDGLSYARPQDHITSLLSLSPNLPTGTWPVGEGALVLLSASPTELAHQADGAAVILQALDAAAPYSGMHWQPCNALALRRGPYVVAAGMDESLDHTGHTLPGSWVNLFDSSLNLVKDPLLTPNSHWLLYDLSAVPEPVWVIACAGRLDREEQQGDTLHCSISGMADTTCALRVRLPRQPQNCLVEGEPCNVEWDVESSTALLRFPNRPEGTSLTITW